MMPSRKQDPYKELEAYLRQAQEEVGKAIEDLLTSTGSSSCSESRKNSCPELHVGDSWEFQEPEEGTPHYKKSPGFIVRQPREETAEWDTYYGWKSLQLSRPPSGDAHLLSVYTERLLEAVNGFLERESGEPCSELDTGPILNGHQHSSEDTSSPGRDAPDTGKTNCRLSPVKDYDKPFRHSVERQHSGTSLKVQKKTLVRSSSWPRLATSGSLVDLGCRCASYPSLAKTIPPFVDSDSSSDQLLNFDGSLYKNQQLYQKPDDVPLLTAEPAVTEIEAKSVLPSGTTPHGVSPEMDWDKDLPELFIQEDDMPRPFTLGGRLNPYTIEVIANHSATPDDVLATVCSLEARLASRLPPLVIDEADTAPSSTHSGSTVSRHELEEFLKNVEPPHEPPSTPQDAVTQTTPEISRCSSFTWVTEFGEDVSSSKESLRIATQITDTATTNSSFPESSSSSCDAPLSPLTPGASTHQVDHLGSPDQIPKTLFTGASPSLPTLADDCQPSTYRQLEEKTQSLSRATTKETNIEALSWPAGQHLSQKASSAPVLLKKKLPLCERPDASLSNTTASAGSEDNAKVFVQGRSQSAKDIKEVEAVHACEWLRQAGFPQYVQMYEDNSFPVDIATVLRDHPSLDPDELQSLFRRLNTLNKCARLKNDGLVKQSVQQDSDEDEGPALSYNWQFHRGSRRWSRISPPLPVPSGPEAYSSHDSVFLDEPRSSPESRLSTSDERIVDDTGHKLRRTGSERVRDAILRRMDSFRSSRKRRQGPGATEDTEPPSDRPETHALSDSECSPQLGHASFKSKHRAQQHHWLLPEQGRSSVYDNVPVSQHGVSPKLGGSASVGSLGRGHEEKPVYSMERRDSGVGSSLTRAGNGSGVPWHCFSSSPERLTCMTALRYEHLSASQMLVLKKLALLHLTALMERFSPPYRSGWGWAVPKFIKRMRAPDYKDKRVFGVPLSVSVQRTGQALPPSIQGAMAFLCQSAPEATGLFRKSGVRSRIQKLRSLHESSTSPLSYEQQQAYDVADLLKQYFRELPDGLLTSKLSDTFLCIFQHIPEELRLDALRAAVLLIPDENREVLESLLVFLDDICRHSSENQMTVANIAVCIAPSLFQLAVARSCSASPRRRATTVGIPDQRELNENRAAHECLARMVVDHKSLFQIPLETLQQCRLEQLEPMTIRELGNPKSYLDSSLQPLILEAREKSKGWASVQHAEVELAFKKPDDGLPLRLWRCAVEVEAPPVELLTRILRERHIWDNTLLKWRRIARIDKHSEVIQYACSSIKPHAPRDFCILRAWRTELAKGSCALVELSVNHPEASPLLHGVRAVVLGSRYLIEPCGAGKSKVTHISRVDLRGRTPDWYNKVYGNLCALLLLRLRDSFAQRTDGPETKV